MSSDSSGKHVCKPSSLIPVPEGHVFCRRLRRALPVDEHSKCSYCFGSEGEIETGRHECFCDFDPKKDPINFGFPDGGGFVDDR